MLVVEPLIQLFHGSRRELVLLSKVLNHAKSLNKLQRKRDCLLFTSENLRELILMLLKELLRTNQSMFNSVSCTDIKTVQRISKPQFQVSHLLVNLMRHLLAERLVLMHQLLSIGPRISSFQQYLISVKTLLNLFLLKERMQ